jgi:hypothetical protein
MFPKSGAPPLRKQTPISRALLSISFGVPSKGVLPPGCPHRAPSERDVPLQWRTEGGSGVQPPSPPKFRSFDKAEPNSQFLGKYIRYNLIRIRVSPICKLSGTPD